MSVALFMLGSNDSDASSMVGAAAALLSARLTARFSPSIVSPDYTGRGADYVNVVAEVSTDLSCDRLLQLADEIEDALGRERSEEDETAVVRIDVDVVMYGNTVLKPDEFASDPFKQGLLWLRQHQNVN